MTEAALLSFNRPAAHEQISTIIRVCSSNRQDLRDAALQGLDLSAAERILDLGCGFGFMSEAVARHAAETAQVIGVDICSANELPFLERVQSTGRRGHFVCMRVSDRLPWPERSFDVVVCSFSLYFFVEVLAEAARVLRPRGLFLAVTHTQRSVAELLRITGITDSESELPRLIAGFSAENGTRILTPWFLHVERTEYKNTLSFHREQEEEFITYLSFKLPFLVSGSECTEGRHDAVARRARARLAQAGRVLMQKDEAIFRCRGPIVP